MKYYSTLLLLLTIATGYSQYDLQNTAKNSLYMKAVERDMIMEINRVRSEPKSYLQYVIPLLNEAKQKLNDYGKGSKNYSLTYTTEYKDGKTYKTIDTTWHFMTEEEVKALSTLVNDLTNLKSLSILQPDKGIYNAAKKHAADQHVHNWQLMHTGTDGSRPWDRITKFSPAMEFGNENIAGKMGDGIPTARDIVLQLLIDEGIPGYGHRYNLLDPEWTHVACTTEKFKEMYWWIQNFGSKRKKNQ